MSDNPSIKSPLFCERCKQELELKEVRLEYLGNTFSHIFPQCPTCHFVYISEEIVESKIKEVEMLLEEK